MCRALRPKSKWQQFFLILGIVLPKSAFSDMSCHFWSRHIRQCITFLGKSSLGRGSEKVQVTMDCKGWIGNMTDSRIANYERKIKNWIFGVCRLLANLRINENQIQKQTRNRQHFRSPTIRFLNILLVFPIHPKSQIIHDRICPQWIMDKRNIIRESAHNRRVSMIYCCMTWSYKKWQFEKNIQETSEI